MFIYMSVSFRFLNIIFENAQKSQIVNDIQVHLFTSVGKGDKGERPNR